MKLPLLELQKAVFQRLNRNISCEVYDNVDVVNNEDGHIPFPYARLGDNTSMNDGTKTDDRTNTTFAVNVFSRTPSQIECKKILSEIVEQITKAPLTLTGFKVKCTDVELVRVYDEFEQTQSSQKIITHCGIVIFRFKILQI